MHYVASYVPLIQEAEVISVKEVTGSPKTKSIKIGNAFDLKALLKPQDTLWLMMGSTNAAFSLGAFRENVDVRQLSMMRLVSFLDTKGNNGEGSGEEGNGHKFKVKTEHVLQAVLKHPDLFYPMGAKQADALEISAAWQAVEDAMEQRKASANFLRSRIYQSAIAYHKIRGETLPQDPKEAMEVLEETLANLLDTKDANGKKKVPGDQHIAFLVEEEDKERKQLESICRKSAFYQHLFGDVEGVGPAIGARFVAAIERIERFIRPEDLSNYAGMMPRGRDKHLPSRFKSKGKTLSRSPELNTACFLLQDYMFQWGRKTPLGQLLEEMIYRNLETVINNFCSQRSCSNHEALRIGYDKRYLKSDGEIAQEETSDQPENNVPSPPNGVNEKDVKKIRSDAVKMGRIAMTRHFLEKILYLKWKEYIGS